MSKPPPRPGSGADQRQGPGPRPGQRRRPRAGAKAAPSTRRPEAPPPVDTPGLVIVGQIVRSHGRDGTLRIRRHSDNPVRFQPGGTLHIDGATHTVASCQTLPNGFALLRLESIRRIDDARRLAGQWLLAPVSPSPELPPGEYYHYQLVGLTVVTDQGETLGRVQEILATGSNDVYVVKSDAGTELLLPAIRQVVQDIDLETGRILVHLLDGLR